jgi:hypothetical protein
VATILLSSPPPSIGSWLAYRLRGNTLELLFSPDEVLGRLRTERAPSLVVLHAAGPDAELEADVVRVREACGPAVPILLSVDLEGTFPDPRLLGRLRRLHGATLVPADRAELLRAVLEALPQAAVPRACRPEAEVPVRRFPDRPVPVRAA